MVEYQKRLQRELEGMHADAQAAEHGAVLSGDFDSAVKMATRVEVLESVMIASQSLLRKMREE